MKMFLLESSNYMYNSELLHSYHVDDFNNNEFCRFASLAEHACFRVMWHEKTGLMYTKYTYSYNTLYLVYSMRFPTKCYINGVFIQKVLNQKCGQILCAHKPGFLMLGHIFVKNYVYVLTTSRLLTP